MDNAEILYREHRYKEAEEICQAVLRLDTENLEATFLLATIYFSQKQWGKALSYAQRACIIGPNIGFLRINKALALQELGQLNEALFEFDEALHLDGPSVNLHYNCGVLLQRLDRTDDARQEFERALALDPKHIGSWINLSAVCLSNDDLDGALHSCWHGLHFDPENVSLTGNLATVYSRLFRYEESLAWYQRLLKIVPLDDRSEVLGRMANILSDLWMVDAAIDCFEQAISFSSDEKQKRALASTRLFMLHYSPCRRPAEIASEHRSWGRNFFPSAITHDFSNTPDPDRPIKIAYLSPDLRIHAVVFFLQPVLAAHDPSRVTVYCYSDVKKPDAVTQQLRIQHNVLWRDCSGLDDQKVLELLQQDEIDILVDLAGHTALNRLPLFAERAAPLQVSWIGYPNTTGLTAMDYRISDAWADPLGLTECLHAEKLIRLPDSFLCYRPGADFPDVSTLPSLPKGYVTFGSLSNFMKVTPDMLDLWARILAKVPDSHLIFRSRGLTTNRFQQLIVPIFSRHKVDADRITVLGHARSVVENLEGYHQIDIALDTFPYHGTTTTCESLCMGVPVITLAGDCHVSRVGVSLLQSVGLSEFIAGSPERYCSIAVTLSGDISRLAALRRSLRDTLLASPLADNSTFTQHLEKAYRQIWQHWCKEARFEYR